MSTAWRHAAMILAGAFLLLGAGLYSMRAALRADRGSRDLLETRSILREVGGGRGLAARGARLAEFVSRLKQEKAAQGGDAAALSRRIEEAFAELGLELSAASGWRPVPNVKLPNAAAFERTFSGTGSFDALLDAVATLESWPDGARLRSLSIGPRGPGRVAFTLEVTVIRTLGSTAAEAG